MANLNQNTGDAPAPAMKKTLDITGTNGRTYDLNDISAEKRSNKDKPLVLQVYAFKAGESPNPANPEIGQIWISKMEK